MQDKKSISTKTRHAVIEELFAEILETPQVYGIETVSKELPKVAEIITEEMLLMYGENISGNSVLKYLQTIPKD